MEKKSLVRTTLGLCAGVVRTGLCAGLCARVVRRVVRAGLCAVVLPASDGCAQGCARGVVRRVVRRAVRTDRAAQPAQGLCVFYVIVLYSVKYSMYISYTPR